MKFSPLEIDVMEQLYKKNKYDTILIEPEPELTETYKVHF